MIRRMTASPGSPTPGPHRFCVAPMMGCTDRHARYLLRLLSRRARLYTEMVPIGALLHGDAGRALRFDPAEHPVALQLGGSDPAGLARCARLAEGAGYDEVNLNVGCPSPRVQRGCFGAALMARPGLVAECVAAMRNEVSVPVTVKTRIGIDDLDSHARFRDFAGAVAGAGCATFIVHARKAWLSGLSPRENREIPPLRHDRVYRLKREMPGLEIVLNGGIGSLEEARTALGRGVDGVMLGRAVWHDLWLLAGVDRGLFGDLAPPSGAARSSAATSTTPDGSAMPASRSWRARCSASTTVCRAPAGGAAPSASSPTAPAPPSPISPAPAPARLAPSWRRDPDGPKESHSRPGRPHVRRAARTATRISCGAYDSIMGTGTMTEGPVKRQARVVRGGREIHGRNAVGGPEER